MGLEIPARNRQQSSYFLRPWRCEPSHRPPLLAAKGAPGGAYLEVITSSVQHVDTCGPIRAGPDPRGSFAPARRGAGRHRARRDGPRVDHDPRETDTRRRTRAAAWVEEVAELTSPDDIHWCAGSDEEWTELTDELVAAGTFVRLDQSKKPNSFYARVRPHRRRARRGPHLHLLRRREGRRAHQQLDGPGRDEGDHDRALPRAACRAARCTSSRSSWATSTPRSRCSASRSPTRPTSSSR